MNRRRVLYGALAGATTAPVFALTLNPWFALLGSIVAGGVVGVLVESRYDSLAVEGAAAGMAAAPLGALFGLVSLWTTIRGSPLAGDFVFVVGVTLFTLVVFILPALGAAGLVSAKVSRAVALWTRRRVVRPRLASRNP